MATHSSILAWRIPRREEPGRLQSWGGKELDTTEVTEAAQETDNKKKKMRTTGHLRDNRFFKVRTDRT